MNYVSNLHTITLIIYYSLIRIGIGIKWYDNAFFNYLFLNGYIQYNITYYASFGTLKQKN